jgi:hypothetical protein
MPQLEAKDVSSLVDKSSAATPDNFQAGARAEMMNRG